MPFNAVPFPVCEALAENIGDNQKVKTAITRGIIDNMARSNNAQIGIRRNALDMANERNSCKVNFEFNEAVHRIFGKVVIIRFQAVFLIC